MPITLSLTGHVDLSDHRLTRSEAREWLAKAAVWFENIGDAVLDARVVRDSDDRAVLLVSLHPAASAVEIRLGATGRVRMQAVTSPVGPGYHAFLCETLDQLAADFDIEWDIAETRDSTGYFESRDLATLEMHFRKWLATMCVAAEANGSRASVGLPAGHGFHSTGDVLTPLGPRPQSWLATAANNPRDFFVWWNPELDADFYRNRALVRLWCDFPWRPPMTEAEGEIADQISNDLSSAFKLDPSAEMPWNEWLELLAAIEADQEGFTVTPADPMLSVELWKRAGPADPPPRPPIGYRRFPVRVSLTNGWSVEVPGDFAREWDEERIWTAWNGPRTVWFQCRRYTKPDGKEPTTDEAITLGREFLPEGEPLPSFERKGVRGEAMYGPIEEEGRTVWRLSGIAAAPGELVVCNVYSEDPADRDWAVKTWQSLRHA